MTPETEGKKTCFVVIGFGEKTDFEQGKVVSSALTDRLGLCARAMGMAEAGFQGSRLRNSASQSIFSSKDEPEDGGWGFLSSWGSFLVFWF